MRVEALRRVCVQSDVQRVRVVKHLQILGRRGRPRCRKGAVPALVARIGLAELKICMLECAYGR